MEKNTGNFLIKIETIRKNSYGGRSFLKSGDIIVALNNQLYTFGEKQFTEELREIKKSNAKAILTVLRDDIFFDIIVENSLGCKFLSITPEETKEIQVKYKSKEINDFDDLTEFVVMRDIYRNYEVFTNSKSLLAGFATPLWLVYSRKWWVFALYVALFAVFASVNLFILFLGWLLLSIYIYSAQLNVLFSFSMLEGKVFCLKIAARSIHDAQKVIRKLDPKSRFMYTKLPPPLVEEVDEQKKDEEISEKGIIDDKEVTA